MQVRFLKTQNNNIDDKAIVELSLVETDYAYNLEKEKLECLFKWDYHVKCTFLPIRQVLGQYRILYNKWPALAMNLKFHTLQVTNLAVLVLLMWMF